MTKHKMTHTGIIRGCDARTPEYFEVKIRLRETKLYWIDKHGRKFSKNRNGYIPGDWPMYALELDSIKKAEEK